MERYITLAPVGTATPMAKGAVLEYDLTNHNYVELTSGEPAGVLMEDVTAGQTPPYAKILFHGPIYEDELASVPNEDLKAQLRKIGIFVEKREEV